ncbi:hypothetical protein QF035_008783 [Streptomyces umbrinus]|uniref:Uncharacterized protein n=1 Tax=Streptomyces umbrinus TaxID=67370 RepID=A0ABU0T5X3_9ACTN|nr:hypothetical protein [Streptomyces umbrinus]MDQ1031201.1 hypothetical protein [Streptomyces umbrinus]
MSEGTVEELAYLVRFRNVETYSAQTKDLHEPVRAPAELLDRESLPGLVHHDVAGVRVSLTEDQPLLDLESLERPEGHQYWTRRKKITFFWLVDGLAPTGRLDEAHALFEDVGRIR